MSLLSKLRGVSSPSASAGVGGSQKDNLRLSRGLCIYPYKVVGQHDELVGQFRSAGWSCPAGRREAGASDFPPLASNYCGGVVLCSALASIDLI